MLILLAGIIVFAAIVLLVLGLTTPKESVLDARMATLRGETQTIDFRVARVESMSTRVMAPLANSIGAKLENLLPSKWIGAIDTMLVQAGQPTTLTGFLVAAVICEAVFVSFGVLMILSAGSVTQTGLMFLGVLSVFGIMGPKIWLSNRVKHRQKAILKSLPDAFDLITVCVEAGLGLEAALARVAEKVQGPFGEELAVCLREVSLGKLRRDALREMSDRIGVPDLSTFISAVIQAESMGTSIATVLRVQAEQMRTRRRQRAEKAAHQAPIKMMFPLVLCIFPTLFIVILGPAGIQIYQQFSSKG